ncbi:VOC family protein [Erysipelothrix urinaevulpis]|uniref:VOC family protein n=1 Tax=Erysipelothrix urinaevulpis TaxID=2683717 RepID=UPI001357C4C0|nr:VOC family protein [Erysipelothrix urinaevulpis]
MNLSSITLKVFDLQRSTEFYERILGLKTRDTQDNKVELGTSDKTLITLLSDLDYYPPSDNRIGLYHLALLLPTESELANYLQHIIDLQFPILGAADHLFSQALYLNDPDGNGIEVYADRPQDQWQRLSDGTLKLVSDPLDVEQLLDKKTQRWDQIPDGTVLGHVHLQTNELQGMEDFYLKTLDFKIESKVPSAIFISNHGYHHDLAVNVWAGPRITQALDNETGLSFISYTTTHTHYDSLKQAFPEKLDASHQKYVEIIDPSNIESRVYSK